MITIFIPINGSNGPGNFLSNQISNTGKKAFARHGFAWLCLTASLGIHVIDEAANDFLSVYNPFVAGLKDRYGSLPFPAFTFQGWITGLTILIVLLFVFSIPVFRGKKIMVKLSNVYGGLMLLNGVAHIVGSFYFGNLIPGFYSTPLLLISSVNLIVIAGRMKRRLVP